MGTKEKFTKAEKRFDLFVDLRLKARRERDTKYLLATEESFLSITKLYVKLLKQVKIEERDQLIKQVKLNEKN